MSLTDLELRALNLLVKGYRQKQIADILGISNEAIKDRLKTVRDKLGTEILVQAAYIATKMKLI